MTKPTFLPGDIFMVDSKKTCPKVVKFFQTAPTVWQHIWRKFFGNQEKVLYYHVGMFSENNDIIEQQGKVIERSSDKLLNTDNNLLVVRPKNITDEQRYFILGFAREDLGEGYDILNCFGKFLTWLTGIIYFARYMELPDKDICINRVAYWYKMSEISTFGAKTHSELTTHTMWKYIIDHPEKFEIIYQGVPREGFGK